MREDFFVRRIIQQEKGTGNFNSAFDLALARILELPAPHQGLLVQLSEVGFALHNILAQFNRTLRLIICEVLVSRAIQVLVPNPTANCV